MSEGEDRLAKIRERWAAATKGPWRWEDTETDEAVANPATREPWGRVSLRTTWTRPMEALPGELPVFILPTVEIEDTGPPGEADANAQAIAHAPEDITWLVGEIERLRDLLRELQWGRE